MVLQEVEKNADAILKAAENIANDISYLESLKQTAQDANNRGVDIGDFINTLQSQVDDINNKLAQISVDISENLDTLLDLDGRVSKSQPRLDFDDSDKHIDKFRAVYQRLNHDKQSLQVILDQINMWNQEHDVEVDGSSAKNLINEIDDALNKFNELVSNSAKLANEYSSIIKADIIAQAEAQVESQKQSPVWKLLIRQTAGNTLSADKWESLNTNDVDNDNYSVLNTLDDSMKGSDGKFEFKGVWKHPSKTNTHYPDGVCVHQWKQSSNPMNNYNVSGYEAIIEPSKSNGWRGMSRRNGHALLVGSDSSWWYGMGTSTHYGVGMPGAVAMDVRVVELWVKC